MPIKIIITEWPPRNNDEWLAGCHARLAELYVKRSELNRKMTPKNAEKITNRIGKIDEDMSGLELFLLLSNGKVKLEKMEE